MRAAAGAEQRAVGGWARACAAPPPRGDQPLRELKRLTTRLPRLLDPRRRPSPGRMRPPTAILRIEAELRRQDETTRTRALNAACANLRCLHATLADFTRTTEAGTLGDKALRAELDVVVGAVAAYAQALAPEDLAVVRALTADDGCAMVELRGFAQVSARTLTLFDRAIWLVDRLVLELSVAPSA